MCDSFWHGRWVTESTTGKNLMEIILLRSTWQAQRSRFHASSSMEPKLNKCTLKLSSCKGTLRGPTGGHFIHIFGMPLFRASSLRYRSKQEAKAIIHLLSPRQEPLPRASLHRKASLTTAIPTAALSPPSAPHPLLPPITSQRWSWGSRSQWGREPGGRLGLLVKPRCVHAEKSSQLGVGCAEKTGWNPVPTLSNVRVLP